jgi:hypothetical protein
MSEDDPKIADLDGKTVGTFLIDEFIAQEERMLETVAMGLEPHADHHALHTWLADRRGALNMFRQSVQHEREKQAKEAAEQLKPEEREELAKAQHQWAEDRNLRFRDVIREEVAAEVGRQLGVTLDTRQLASARFDCNRFREAFEAFRAALEANAS